MAAVDFYEVWYILEDGSEVKCWTYTSVESAHRFPAEGVRRTKGIVGYRVKKKLRGDYESNR